MKTINANTSKLAKGLISSYKCAFLTDIMEAYKKPSDRKIEAFNTCLLACKEEGGVNFRIVSHAMYFFTVAWRVGNNLKVDTGRNVYFIIDAF